ncbi:MAG: TlpA disulfide reductase family protein [Pseudomonadales bacterium]
MSEVVNEVGMRDVQTNSSVNMATRPLLALLALLTLAACARPPEEVAYARGGGTSWENLQGQWLLINYWAEWCAPCRVEIPELNEFHEHGRDFGIMVLGVNFDGIVGEPLVEVMDRMDVQFPVLIHDPRARWDLPPPSVLPSTLVIGPDGELRDVLVGPQTFESLSEAVEFVPQL